jgi:ATP-dependent Clp protease ATP-binding subunit ClpA
MSRQEQIMILSKWAVLRECSVAGMTKYTKRAQSVVFYAYGVARHCGAQEIRPEHLLLGIIASDKSLAHRLGLPTADVVFGTFNLRESDEHTLARPHLSETAKQVMSFAGEERERLGHLHTGTEHLLLGIIRAKGATSELFERHGISFEGVRDALHHQASMISWNVVESVRT